MSVPIYPGDSGSPIFAFNKGVPIIVGVAHGVSWNELGNCYYYASRIDSVKHFIDVKK
jgi:hypothetical protein